MAQSHEDEIRSVERLVRARERLLECGGQGGLRHDRAGPHRSVVVDNAGVPDGRHGGSAHDDELCRRDVDGVAGCAIAHDHGVAQPFVQLGERGRAEDDLV